MVRLEITECVFVLNDIYLCFSFSFVSDHSDDDGRLQWFLSSWLDRRHIITGHKWFTQTSGPVGLTIFSQMSASKTQTKNLLKVFPFRRSEMTENKEYLLLSGLLVRSCNWNIFILFKNQMQLNLESFNELMLAGDITRNVETAEKVERLNKDCCRNWFLHNSISMIIQALLYKNFQ